MIKNLGGVLHAAKVSTGRRWNILDKVLCTPGILVSPVSVIKRTLREKGFVPVTVQGYSHDREKSMAPSVSGASHPN